MHVHCAAIRMLETDSWIVLIFRINERNKVCMDGDLNGEEGRC